MAQSVQVGNSEISEHSNAMRSALCAMLFYSAIQNLKSQIEEPAPSIPQRAISTNQLPLCVHSPYLSEAVRKAGRIALYGYKGCRHSRDEHAQVLDPKKLGAVKSCAANNFFNWLRL